MADKIDDGGPAFPTIDGPPGEYLKGMSLRDYFAIHADWEDVRHYAADERGFKISRTRARYIYADAMLKARKGEL